jgi:epoxide hydrolase-like predicted phosphatase
MDGVRAVVFDIGGVLERTEGWEVLAARWDARMGFQPGEFERRLRASGLGLDAALGRISEEAFNRSLGELYGIDGPLLEEFVADQWDWYAGELDAEVAGYFRRLRPRYRTAMLSNSMVGARREEEARYGFAAMTDLLVYSHEEGIAKPDPAIYRRTCERLGVRSDETVFVDDTEACVAAAREFGMRGVRFQTAAQALAEVDEQLATPGP